MPNPTSGILDNYNIRWNWGTSELEMNTGNETWVAVPINIAGQLALSNGKIYVGNGSNVAVGVTPSGGFTLANTGVATLDNTSVTGQALTGFVSASGSITSADTLLTAFNKVTANQKANLPGITTPAGTGTVTPNASVSSLFEITVSGALTLNGPSSPTDGQRVLFSILNDASHAVTLATGSGNFRFGTDITSYTNSVSKTDYIGAIYNSTATRWDIVSIIQGF